MYISHELRVFKVSEIINHKLSLPNSYPFLTCVTIHEFNERFNMVICEFLGFLFELPLSSMASLRSSVGTTMLKPSEAGSAWPPSRPEGSVAHNCLHPLLSGSQSHTPTSPHTCKLWRPIKSRKNSIPWVLAHLDLSPSLWKVVLCFRCLGQFPCQGCCVVS